MMFLMNILMKTEDKLFSFSKEIIDEMTTLILGIV